MHSVGIIGHRAGDFRVDLEELGRKIKDLLGVLQFQYKEELMLNVDGETGVGQLAIDAARELGVKYHIFLPAPIDTMGNDLLLEEQKKKLIEQYQYSSSTTIASYRYDQKNLEERDHLLVDASSFMVYFWEGKRQGRTFDSITYAMNTNRMSFNGLTDMRYISRLDLSKRKITNGKT